MSKEKYTKKLPSPNGYKFTLGEGPQYEQDVASAKSFNALPVEERKRRVWAERKSYLIPAAIGYGTLGALAIGLHEATGNPWIIHHHDKTPIEKLGNHYSQVNDTQPGTGTMHTKSGDFHVTQK
jgi:hypothetical protein